MGAWGYGEEKKNVWGSGSISLSSPGSNDDQVAMICDHRSKIKRSICNGILKLLDWQLINLNVLFSSKDEDSQLKAIDFGLSYFVKLGWSSKVNEGQQSWSPAEDGRLALAASGGGQQWSTMVAKGGLDMDMWHSTTFGLWPYAN
ncbi:Hypothetical predicted protein [Prunus dulcis]|uniref:Uncharacterized protein n=1 Tax=Prunus dulcis TaxID=3755 RepID=A0A5E4FH59_PRUDU|nr:Hypothetical predicted protein [Prunus dulcis]